MKVLAGVLMIGAAFLGAAILYAYIENVYFVPSGLEETGSAALTIPLVLSSCSLLGILSKRLFDTAMARPKGNFGAILSDALAPAALIGSIVACPIVMVSLYSRLREIQDIFLIGLIAYQNGFFFEAVLQARSKLATKEALS
jgi:hypothetical protein